MSVEILQLQQERQSALEEYRRTYHSLAARLRRGVSYVIMAASSGGGATLAVASLALAPEHSSISLMGAAGAITLALLGSKLSERLGQPTKAEKSALSHYYNLLSSR